MKLTLLRLTAVLNLFASAGCGIVVGGGTPAHAAVTCVGKGLCDSDVTVTESDSGACTVQWAANSFRVQRGAEDVLLRWKLVQVPRSSVKYSWATQTGVKLKDPGLNDLDNDLDGFGRGKDDDGNWIFFIAQAINKGADLNKKFEIEFVVLKDQGPGKAPTVCESAHSGSVVLRVAPPK